MSKKYRHDYTGRRYGRLLVTRFYPDDTYTPKWECICDCGAEVVVWSQSLRRGMTKSCGCLNKEINSNRSHRQSGCRGRKRTGEYSSWANMMMRSEWLSHPSSENYGKKGIGVDERWHSFENFYADMGDRPKGCSIDRIDGSKGYSKDNCRWATGREQMLNRRTTIRVKYKGELMPAFILSQRLGVSHAAIRARASRRGNDYVQGFRSAGINVEYPSPEWPRKRERGE